jgi:hypothetical protein
MIVVNLKGGLGNQMFQYALGYALSKKNKTQFYLDDRYLNDRFIKYFKRNYVKRIFQINKLNLKYKIAKKKIIRIFSLNNKIYFIRYFKIIIFSLFCPKKYIYENKYIYNKNLKKLNSLNIYLDGYWQNEKYFYNYKKEIKEIFINGIKIKNKKINNFLRTINSQHSVCVNVRRADYTNNNNNLDLNYYLKAIKLIKKKYNNLKFFIFSDDLVWCRKIFSNLGVKYSIVDHTYAGNYFTTYLYLMTQFKTYIISNSTFSWWGAWLSKFSKPFIIAPKKWFPDSNLVSDIVPKDWTRI